VRFDTSPFAKKCSSSMSRIVGSNLVCSFVSILGKQALQKKCLQTFSDYGAFKRYVITQNAGQLSRFLEFRNSGKMEHVCVGSLSHWAFGAVWPLGLNGIWGYMAFGPPKFCFFF
jgi:hypothetical protein